MYVEDSQPTSQLLQRMNYQTLGRVFESTKLRTYAPLQQKKPIAREREIHLLRTYT